MGDDILFLILMTPLALFTLMVVYWTGISLRNQFGGKHDQTTR